MGRFGFIQRNHTARDGAKMSESDSLERFVEAQNRHWQDILTELRAGRKTTHWMWYVFPQLRGLGRTEAARFYGIGGDAEARAYLDHNVLGPRLRECCAILQGLEGLTAEEIFGTVDAMKLRSCMTLFGGVEPGDVFGEVLEQYYRADEKGNQDR